VQYVYYGYPWLALFWLLLCPGFCRKSEEIMEDVLLPIYDLVPVLLNMMVISGKTLVSSRDAPTFC